MYSSLATSVELTGLLLLLAGILSFWVVSFASDCRRVGSSKILDRGEDRDGIEFKRSLARQYITRRPQRYFSS
jgi:hypothetical protein